GNSQALNAHYSVVEFPSGVLTQSDNNTSSPTINGTTNVTLGTPINLDHSLVSFSAKLAASSSRTAFPTSLLTSSSNLQLEGGGDSWQGSYLATYYVTDTSGYAQEYEGSGIMMSLPINFDEGNRDSNNNAWNEVSFTADETDGDVKIRLY